MSVQNIDKEALSAVVPDDLQSYLLRAGWREKAPLGESIKRFLLRRGDDEFEALLPLRPDFRDYAARVWDLVQTLSTVEHRNAVELLNALNAAGEDVFRFRSLAETAADGSLPLLAGLNLIQGAGESVTAAACAATGVRRVMTLSTSRLPKAVSDYLRKVRLGQTERGSYVVTVASPVPPYVDPAGAGLLFERRGDIPFERKVSLTLAKSLSNVQDVIDDSRGLFSEKPWEEAIEKGVSANLCESILKMSGIESRAEVEIRVAWALNRPPESQVRSVFTFSANAMSQIDAAARWLRAAAPISSDLITGYVRELSNPPHGHGEQMMVYALIEGRVVKVHVTVPEQFRVVAISAYDGGMPVACRGRLVTHGQEWYIEEVQSVSLLEEVIGSEQQTLLGLGD